MAIRGRKPRSAAQKRLEGNPGKRPIQREPDFAGGEKLAPPRRFTVRSEERREWDRIVPELVRCGIAKAVHQGLLEKICEFYADALELRKRGDLTGARLMAESYRKALSEFGLTPTSAGRVGGATALGAIDDDAEDFFGPRLDTR